MRRSSVFCSCLFGQHGTAYDERHITSLYGWCKANSTFHLTRKVYSIVHRISDLNCSPKFSLPTFRRYLFALRAYRFRSHRGTSYRVVFNGVNREMRNVAFQTPNFALWFAELPCTRSASGFIYALRNRSAREEKSLFCYALCTSSTQKCPVASQSLHHRLHKRASFISHMMMSTKVPWAANDGKSLCLSVKPGALEKTKKRYAY